MVIVSGSYGNSTTHLHLSNVYIAVVSIDGWTGKEWGEGGEGEGRRGNMYMRTHTNVHAHVHTHTHTHQLTFPHCLCQPEEDGV